MQRATAPRPPGAAERLGTGRSGKRTTCGVRDATPADLPGIVRVAEALAETAGASVWQNRGYLASGYDESVYERALGDGSLLLVVAQGQEVRGFLYGYVADESSDPAVRAAAEEAVPGTAFLIKQVGVLPNEAGRGLGSLLYEELEQRVYPLPLVAAVITSPPNVPSLRFHEAKGFQIGARFSGDDGRKRLLLVKTPPTRLNQGSDLMLVEQYKTAVLLYQHEDKLNWTKLNNYLYINAGLLAALGISLQGSGDVATFDRIQSVFTLAVTAVGIVASIVFALALVSGAAYLHARKHSVVEIEHRLIAMGGSPVVDWYLTRGETGNLWRSRTAVLLRIVPVLAGLGWSAAALFALRAI